ncbi:MAG: hypothetical protein WCR20_00630, partial [Verrucomicrobiota bacterium]
AHLVFGLWPVVEWQSGGTLEELSDKPPPVDALRSLLDRLRSGLAPAPNHRLQPGTFLRLGASGIPGSQGRGCQPVSEGVSESNAPGPQRKSSGPGRGLRMGASWFV